MKKILIPFVAAFGLSLGAATGIVVVRAPKPAPAKVVPKVAAPKVAVVPTAADSAAAAQPDSSGQPSAVASASGDSGIVASPKATTQQGKVAESAPDAHANTKKDVPTTPAPSGGALASAKLASAPVKPIAPPKPVSDSLIGRRLAQVFSAMQPKDAARVLEQMSDGDVRAILGSLSSKQQAAILGSFPTQRAALILQATLRTSAGGVE